MCAIAGAVGIRLTGKTVQNMLRSMARRGPDGSGVYEEGGCTLLHTRLAIIDPAGGSQPMRYVHDGVGYVISYNGELYNTEDLRAELISLGHSFQGHSDTEVLVHAVAQWKEAALYRLNGIYAFAVWNEAEKELLLARDRMGVKPLFYWTENGKILFASEIKTLLQAGVPARLDEEGVAQLILLGPGRVPGSGVLKDIYELQPGFYAKFRRGKLNVHRYWYLQDHEHEDTLAQTAEKLGWLVKDAIHKQMVSDVPIGMFLSGGLDSSLISALCCAASETPPDTFSLEHEGQDQYFTPSKFQPNSDSSFIQRMLQDLNTHHHWTVLSAAAQLDALQEATEARDLPGMADVDFSLLLFCGDIRKRVKVALSGECADEIFGGYPWYRDPEIRNASGFPWAQNTAYRASFLTEDWKRQADYVMDQYETTIRGSDIGTWNTPQERRIKEMVNLNMKWFMQTLLDRKDRMSMYHSLEVRVPFCDHRIAEYMYTVPWVFKEFGGVEKGLLRHCMEGVLPKEILWRKKSPYPKTHDPHYTKLVEDRFRDLLEDRSAPIFHILSANAMGKLLQCDDLWPWYGQLMRRPQTMVYMLQLDYWLRRYGVEII